MFWGGGGFVAIETGKKLEDFLNQLIARDLNIKPEEVTPQFIHDMRERMNPVAWHQYRGMTRFLYYKKLKLKEHIFNF